MEKKGLTENEIFETWQEFLSFWLEKNKERHEQTRKDLAETRRIANIERIERERKPRPAKTDFAAVFASKTVEEWKEELMRPTIQDTGWITGGDPFYLPYPKKPKYSHHAGCIVFIVSNRDERDSVASIEDEIRAFYKKKFGDKFIGVLTQSEYMRRECPCAFIEY